MLNLEPAVAALPTDWIGHTPYIVRQMGRLELGYTKAPPLKSLGLHSRSSKIGLKEGHLICSKNMFGKALK